MQVYTATTLAAADDIAVADVVNTVEVLICFISAVFVYVYVSLFVYS